MKALKYPRGSPIIWLLALRLPAAWGAPESTTGPAGHWEGAIVVPGSPIAIRVEVERGADQAWHGWLDIPPQRAYALKLDPLNVDAASLSFGVPSILGGARFTGRLAEHGRTVTGDYAQTGLTFPFKLERNLWTSTLLRAHGDYLLATGSAKDPWIEFSLPFPFEGQTPLQVSVTTEPPGRLAQAEIIPDEENRYLRVHLRAAPKHDLEPSKPLPGDPISVRLEAVVMVRDRPLRPVDLTPVPPRAELPPEVAQYFAPTPGIDPLYPGIDRVAKSLPVTSLGAVIGGVNLWLMRNIRGEAGGDQGAAYCFETRKAVCTGYANLAASLFQAAGVPCRVLGCLSDKRVQEHFIVEVWASGAGWRRVESTRFPIPDSEHLILHVAHPKFPRNRAQAACYVRGAEGCLASFKYGADNGAWQGMDSLGAYSLTAEEADALEAGARQAFAAWGKTPAKRPTLRLAPPRASFATPSANLAALLGQLGPEVKE